MLAAVLEVYVVWHVEETGGEQSAWGGFAATSKF